jgi:hypothetical protein
MHHRDCWKRNEESREPLLITERDLQLHVTRHYASASFNMVALSSRGANRPSILLLEGGVVLQCARSIYTDEIGSAHLENIRNRILRQDDFS